MVRAVLETTKTGGLDPQEYTYSLAGASSNVPFGSATRRCRGRCGGRRQGQSWPRLSRLPERCDAGRNPKSAATFARFQPPSPIPFGQARRAVCALSSHRTRSGRRLYRRIAPSKAARSKPVWLTRGTPSSRRRSSGSSPGIVALFLVISPLIPWILIFGQ